MLKFAYQDFLDDRKFKNTSEVNIQNYKMLLGKFIDYCVDERRNSFVTRPFLMKAIVLKVIKNNFVQTVVIGLFVFAMFIGIFVAFMFKAKMGGTIRISKLVAPMLESNSDNVS
ncbi:hypothetical protein ACIQXF_12725 [Lysinibacillus sp. NPDC097231]|uniref:hypothetical protein n=1 Tax=Lysinibacillus sp. NPDC097231 TaxID=3364142 RepID=UPI0038004F37